MKISLALETPVSRSPRARQLESLFDVPPAQKSRVAWNGDVPIEAEDWNVGLIVGPSGTGKTQIKRQMFGEEPPIEWPDGSVIDGFPETLSMQDVTAACQAVGFNTIPAWLRPFSVLSNGEQFRVNLARRLLSDADPIVVDEFSSVVDRQVAQIASHAVQKYCRRANRRFVAVSCHYDIIDWLQPDWVFEPATWNFQRRPPRGRPELECSIERVPYSAWRLFAPFHYLTSELHRAAACYVLFVGDQPTTIAAMLHRPSTKAGEHIWGLSRLVTLPDWQGLGLAFVLTDRLAALYAAQGRRFHTYPAHPALIRSFDRSPNWRMEKRPGVFSGRVRTGSMGGNTGGRPNAVFSWVGQKGDPAESRRLIGDFSVRATTSRAS